MFVLRRAMILGLAAAVAVTALAAQETFNLRVNPAKDEVFRYKNTGSLDVMGMTVKAEYTSMTKVLEVSDTQSVLESGEVKGSIDVAGQIMEMPDMGSVKSTYDAAGVVTKMEGDAVSPEAYRSAQLLTVYRPAEAKQVGDTWTWTPAADAEKGTLKLEAKFTLEAVEEVEGIRALKIKMEAKELEGAAPASVSGTIWISAANAIPVKMEADVKNLPFPGAPEPISGTMKQIILK